MSSIRSMQRWVGILVLGMLGWPLVAAPTAAADCEDAALAPGDEAFCAAVNVDRAQVPGADFCGVAGDCPQWQITVADGGARLRVALSAVFQEAGDVRPWADFNGSAPEMIFRLQLLDEAGGVVAEDSTGETFTAYGVEVFLVPPEAGVYTVRVIPESVVDMAFRLRAKLEVDGHHEADHHRRGADRTVLTPNLRAIPPFEFNFYPPSATYGPGAPVAAPQASCMVEEIEEAVEEGRPAPRLCLRYSMGFENAGDGIFWLSVFCPACQHYYPHTKPIGDTICSLFGCAMGEVVGQPWQVGEDARDWPLTQIRFYADGSCCQVETLGSAGVGRFHAAHGHLHYQNAYLFELFRVNDEGWSLGDPRPRQLELVGPGSKLGVFPGDEMMSGWDRFYQYPRSGACPQSPPEHPDHCGPGMGNSPLLGLGEPKVNAGWGDIYEWNRGGNYVDFPTDELGQPLAGYYVLRGTSDPDRVIIETDERDNHSYGFIHVSGDGTVELLERGYGTSPWDGSTELVTVVPG
ncbi:MAG: hypothetical protein KY469_00150 [Actinobacteria bacterium]|nr:hypothetical protein [Actinomycetota bacterium]